MAVTTFTEEEIAEGRALLKAAVLDLRTNGWHKGGFFDYPWADNDNADYRTDDIPNNCPACALGSIVRATGKQTYQDAFDTTSYKAAERLLMEKLGGRPIGPWNDYEADTVEDVISLFEEISE